MCVSNLYIHTCCALHGSSGYKDSMCYRVQNGIQVLILMCVGNLYMHTCCALHGSSGYKDSMCYRVQDNIHVTCVITGARCHTWC